MYNYNNYGYKTQRTISLLYSVDYGRNWSFVGVYADERLADEAQRQLTWTLIQQRLNPMFQKRYG